MKFTSVMGGLVDIATAVGSVVLQERKDEREMRTVMSQQAIATAAQQTALARSAAASKNLATAGFAAAAFLVVVLVIIRSKRGR